MLNPMPPTSIFKTS